MSITPGDVSVLVELVTAEYGEQAVAHVDAYVNSLRKDGEKESATLWSKVLAMLSCTSALANDRDQKDQNRKNQNQKNQNRKNRHKGNRTKADQNRPVAFGHHHHLALLALLAHIEHTAFKGRNS